MKSFIPSFWQKHQPDAALQKLQYQAQEQEHLELLRQESAQLLADQITAAKTLSQILKDRYRGRLALDAIRGIRPYKTGAIIGSTFFPEIDDSGVHRINVNIATDNSFVGVEACTPTGTDSFMYVHEQDLAYLKQGDARIPITDTRTAEGLQRFRTVCEALGNVSLATA